MDKNQIKSRKDVARFVVGEDAEEKGHGFLGEFLQYKMITYQEPSRKGTPRGERVGLSKQKFYAALLCGLTNSQYKQVAKATGVSYSLLLKWRTEDAFKEAEQQAVNEFVDEIVYRLRRLRETEMGDIDSFLTGEGPEPGVDPNRARTVYDRILVDAYQYSEQVLDRIIEASMNPPEFEDDPIAKFTFGKRMLDIARYANNEKPTPQHPLVLKAGVRLAREMIEQGNTSEKDMRFIILMLKGVEHEFGNIFEALTSKQRD